MTINALACTAMHFLQDHENEHLAHDLGRLIERCVDHVRETHGVSNATARTAALQAHGELEARHCKASIDCSRTTSFTLFLTDENGKPVVMTVAELARLVRQTPPARLTA